MLKLSERFKILLFTAIWLTAGSASAAQDEARWYDVEVILFAQKSQSYRESELWPIDYTMPDMENARELLKAPAAGKTADKPVAFRELTPNELKLNDDAERIDKASDLELLSHFGWRQPGLADDQAVAVRVSVPAEASADKATTQTGSDGAMMAAPAEPPRLEGTLKLILSRYLHIDVDLLYREPLSADENVLQTPVEENMPVAETGAGQATAPVQHQDLFMMAEQTRTMENQAQYRVYRMQQSRRMRSGELHYLDHPVFGLAVMVTPYEPPAKTAAAPAQN